MPRTKVWLQEKTPWKSLRSTAGLSPWQQPRWRKPRRAEEPQAPPAWGALSHPLIASCSPSPPRATWLLPARRDANGNREAGHLLEAHAPYGRGRLARGARGSAISSVVIVFQKMHQSCASCAGALHVCQGFGWVQWDIQGRLELVGCSNT